MCEKCEKVKSNVAEIDNEFKKAINEACVTHLEKCDSIKLEGATDSKLATTVNATMTLAIALSELMLMAEDIDIPWQSVVISAMVASGKIDLKSSNIDELKSKIEAALKGAGVKDLL